ncbi:uncharacterized protein PAC_04457 [Phialocephala subalpina]|uniref:L-dopachrome isomerase n=1 Tax=Phialocephala subalpina TaxID=576137 RepID=A0A1L7WP73_9HELO|nr:uncharacterized protein PAC_04457 [Phialocephala subalpina]
MPGSVRTIDATSQRYDPVDSLPSSPDKEQTTRRASTTISQISQIQLPPSPPAEVDLHKMREGSPRSGSPAALSSISKEGRRITRDIGRGAPGDQAIFSNTKTPEQKALAKRKSQYYGEVFANREPIASARERVLRESPIIADVRTNVIIQDEFSFITELSYFLSNRYQRPENSIVVSLAHSCCMLYGGNFDPAYTLTITALGSQLQPTTNKRNASLLAKHIDDSLGVDPKRGVIKFIAIAEENLATDGKTISGEVEQLEKEQAETNSSLYRGLSHGTNKSKRRQSMKSLRGTKTGGFLPTHNESLVSLSLATEDIPPLPAMPTEKSSMDRKAEKAQRIGRRKSFMATLFGKS